MDIAKRREELLAEFERGQGRYRSLSNEIAVLETNLKRIEGAICLCDEILNGDSIPVAGLDSQTIMQDGMNVTNKIGE